MKRFLNHEKWIVSHETTFCKMINITPVSRACLYYGIPKSLLSNSLNFVTVKHACNTTIQTFSTVNVFSYYNRRVKSRISKQETTVKTLPSLILFASGHVKTYRGAIYYRFTR